MLNGTGDRYVLSESRGRHASGRETYGERPDGLQSGAELDERRVSRTGPRHEFAVGQVQKRADQSEKVQTTVRPPQVGVLAKGRPARRRSLQYVFPRAHILSAEFAAIRRDRTGVVRKREQRFPTYVQTFCFILFVVNGTSYLGAMIMIGGQTDPDRVC